MKTVFKISKETKKIEFKTIFNFKKELHNSDKENYIYYNFNHKSELWETQPNTYNKKLLTRCKNIMLMLELCNDWFELEKLKQEHKEMYKKSISLPSTKEEIRNEIRENIIAIRAHSIATKKSSKQYSTTQ